MNGTLVGCDKSQEWLLPWWWSYYSEHNDLPVVFANFGMSEEGKLWCKERGTILEMPASPTIKDPSSLEVRMAWENLYGPGIWKARPLWFKKPLACLNSPFTRTLWIDLDCKVEGNLSPLLNALMCGTEMMAARDRTGFSYNSGVIAFTQNSSALKLWSVGDSREFPGDQEALFFAIEMNRLTFLELSPIYNWSWDLPENKEAIITHFHGFGKKKIATSSFFCSQSRQHQCPPQ